MMLSSLHHDPSLLGSLFPSLRASDLQSSRGNAKQDEAAQAAASPEASSAAAAQAPYSYLHAMMQVEIQSTRSIRFANGATITENLQMSYRAEAALAAYGQNNGKQGLTAAGQFTELLSLEHRMTMEGPVTQDQINFFQDYFSPEKTAERIGQFALSGFSGDAGKEADRAAWKDYILPAVKQGFDAAREQLGKLPEELDRTVNSMLDSIQQMLDRFVSQGLLPGAKKILPEPSADLAPLTGEAPLSAPASLETVA